jgi:hypothetical protein
VSVPEVEQIVRRPRWGLVAKGQFRIHKDQLLTLSVTSDDGVRVRIDGRVVLDDWTWHAPKTDEVLLGLKAGDHELQLEYFQIDGAQALRLELRE